MLGVVHASHASLTRILYTLHYLQQLQPLVYYQQTQICWRGVYQHLLGIDHKKRLALGRVALAAKVDLLQTICPSQRQPREGGVVVACWLEQHHLRDDWHHVGEFSLVLLTFSWELLTNCHDLHVTKRIIRKIQFISQCHRNTQRNILTLPMGVKPMNY